MVLVGHSFAGVTVPRVLDLLPDRIRHVVLVSAVVPPDGSRVLDQVDPGVRDLVEQSIAGGVYHQTREGAAAVGATSVVAAYATNLGMLIAVRTLPAISGAAASHQKVQIGQSQRSRTACIVA